MSDPIPRDTIYIPQGSMFKKSWALVDADTGLAASTTGWSARCEVRTQYGGALVTRFHSNNTWVGKITFDGLGNMTLTLDAVYTTALDVLPTPGVFDVELIDPNGKPWRVVYGTAHVTPEATTDV